MHVQYPYSHVFVAMSCMPSRSKFFVVQLVRKLTIVRVLSLYFQEKVFLQLFMRWSSLLRREYGNYASTTY